MTTGYEIPWDDYAARLAAADAAIARVRALMVAHRAKDGRVPVCQLRTALDGAR
jgi:hypothetical protein